MNKEVNYVLQGFLLTVVVIGAFKFGGLLLSIPSTPKGFSQVNASPPPARVIALNSTGKALFNDNCEACHTIRMDVPASLLGIEQKIPDKRLLYDWIRNSSAVLQSGNKYFNTLVSKYGGVRMTDFPHLTDDDITAILEYARQVDTIRNTSSAIVVD